jgi:putative FmdB family regulatory protein
MIAIGVYNFPMPIYEFRCRTCEQEFESLIPSSKLDDATCPSCGAGEPRRLMSVIAGMGGRAADPAPTCGAGACARCS